MDWVSRVIVIPSPELLPHSFEQLSYVVDYDWLSITFENRTTEFTEIEDALS